MSADNYMMLRKHPDGGIAVINASASSTKMPTPERHHPRFDTLGEALDYAFDQDAKYGITVHGEVRK